MRTAICLLAAVVFFGSAWAKPVSRPKKTKPPREPVTVPVPASATTSKRQYLDCSSAIPVRIGDFVASDNTGATDDVATYSCIPSWDEWGGRGRLRAHDR